MKRYGWKLGRENRPCPGAERLKTRREMSSSSPCCPGSSSSSPGAEGAVEVTAPHRGVQTDDSNPGETAPCPRLGEPVGPTPPPLRSAFPLSKPRRSPSVPPPEATKLQGARLSETCSGRPRAPEGTRLSSFNLRWTRTLFVFHWS